MFLGVRWKEGRRGRVIERLLGGRSRSGIGMARMHEGLRIWRTEDLDDKSGYLAYA